MTGKQDKLGIRAHVRNLCLLSSAKKTFQVFIVHQTLRLPSVQLLTLGQSRNSGLLACFLTYKPEIVIRILGPGLVMRIQSDGPCKVFSILPSSLHTRCLFC